MDPNSHVHCVDTKWDWGAVSRTFQNGVGSACSVAIRFFNRGSEKDRSVAEEKLVSSILKLDSEISS